MSNLFPQSQEGKLNIYFHVSENSGVGYYRQYLPAITLREQGLANVMISDFQWGEGNHTEPDHELLFSIMNWADIVIVGRKDIPQFYADWGGIREFFNIPIIMDTDDNVRHVRPYNPGYQGYHPGADSIVWNEYAIRKVFDAITVSTQDLKEFHEKENPKTFIAPNNLDVKWWNSFEKKKWNDNNIRIGFIGSAAHWEGVNIIKKPIIEILQKYSNVEFYITHVYTAAFEHLSEEIKKRIIPVPWISLKEWPKELKDLGLDIGLAPLTDNYFNRAKSNLRWMEYSISHTAVIASAVKPYLCINHGKDGFLAKEDKEWFSIMEDLVTNPDLRYNIGNTAYQRISQEFDIDKNIKLWDNIYRDIYKKYYEFHDPKRIFLQIKEGKAGKKAQYREVLRGQLKRKKVIQ